MSTIKGDSAVNKKQILFLFPLVYRPLKENFGKRFALLSRWYFGHIFALSGKKQRYKPVSDFYFHAEQYLSNPAKRILPGAWVQIIFPLRFLWGKSRVDAVVAYDPFKSGFAALVLKNLLRCKMIVEVNGDYHMSESGGGYAGNVKMQASVNLVLRNADAIRVLNENQEAFYRRLLPSASIYRLPDFVATEYFASLASYQGDYLLSVGYPFDLKGMDILIDAFKLIAEKYEKVTLRIMGHCPEAELEKYNAIAGGHPRIVFIQPGWIEEVGEQMRGCYALVNAARSEAMGRVHIEAMACAKPIVATRTNGAVVCVADGQTGLLCKMDDAEDLAEKLDELLSAPDRARRMGQAGKVRMEQLFSEETYVEAFHRMIEEVTETNRGR